MKAKTFITLSKELATAIDQYAGRKVNRSEFKAAVWAFIAQMVRNEQNARDLEVINRRADRLNQEATDVLEYRVIL